MAHLSSLAKCKLQMKNLRKFQAKKKAKISKLICKVGEEKYLEMKNNEVQKTLREEVAIILWDIDNHQCPISKRHKILKTLANRLEEIKYSTDQREKKEVEKIKKAMRSIRK